MILFSLFLGDAIPSLPRSYYLKLHYLTGDLRISSTYKITPTYVNASYARAGLHTVR
jgi:hypothetical protein